MNKTTKIDISLLALGCAGVAACSSEGSPARSLGPDTAAAEHLVAVVEQCDLVTFIEVVHTVNGAPVTDRLRLTDEVSADAALALRSFQVATNYFGAANVVSSRPISQIHCSPGTPAAASSAGKLDVTGSSLCVHYDGVVDCTPTTPSHTYTPPSFESCNVNNYHDAVSLSCADSSAIVTRHGDVVLTVNTANLRAEALERTQVLRRLVGDENVVTNFHFDIAITPDQQASIVGNSDFANINAQVRQASQAGQPLPDIGAILQGLPSPPTNVDFYTQLTKAYAMKIERLNLLAQFTSGALLSPQQVNAFYQNFVVKSRLVDQLDVEHSASSLNQAATILNDAIGQLATTDRSSTIYNQVKAGTQSLLEAHTCKGVFDPDRTIDFVVPDLYQSLTDPSVEKRLMASERLIDFNEVLRQSPGASERAAALAGPIGLMALAMANDDMERAWRLYDQVEATEFFFDNDDPSGTSYDVHLTPEAQAMFNIQAQPNSAIAYEVINLLNETAEYDTLTGRVTVDFRAIITINARQALSTDDLKRALYHTEESYGILNFLKTAAPAFLGGALSQLGSTVTGIVYTAAAFWSDPEAFVDHLKSAVVNWRQTMDIVLQEGIDVIHRWPNMTLEEKSELLGRLATEIVLSLPDKARQAGRLNEAVRDAARIHLDKAARGLAVVERSGVALSTEAAVELVKRLERHELTAIDDLVRVADAIDDALPCDLVGTSGLSTRSGVKPPCNVTQIASAFEKLAARAQQMGFTAADDLSDLMQSRGIRSIPGFLDKRAMSADEVSFAHQILAKDGGTMVGNNIANRQAIDGFFRGEPIQLKKQSSQNWSTIRAAIVDTRTSANAVGIKEIRMYQWLENVTKSDLLYQLGHPRKDWLSLAVPGGAIRSLDFLTSDGFWVHVEDGVVR
ncbi:MAG: hypothetical protein R3B48_19595 [Kofleriaceae bacterium]